MIRYLEALAALLALALLANCSSVPIQTTSTVKEPAKFYYRILVQVAGSSDPLAKERVEDGLKKSLEKNSLVDVFTQDSEGDDIQAVLNVALEEALAERAAKFSFQLVDARDHALLWSGHTARATQDVRGLGEGLTDELIAKGLIREKSSGRSQFPTAPYW